MSTSTPREQRAGTKRTAALRFEGDDDTDEGGASPPASASAVKRKKSNSNLAKRAAPSSGSPGPSTSGTQEPSREETMREARKLRNRRAAQASRDRQKDYIKQLEERVQDLESQLEVAQAAGALSHSGLISQSATFSSVHAMYHRDEARMQRVQSSTSSAETMSDLGPVGDSTSTTAGTSKEDEDERRSRRTATLSPSVDGEGRVRTYKVLDTARETFTKLANLF